MRRLPLLVSVFALACLLPGPARAEEVATEPAPPVVKPPAANATSAAFETLVGGLPAPTAEKGLLFEADLVMGDRVLGSMDVTASPAQLDGKQVWRVVEKLRFGAALKHDGTAYLDARLQPLQGRNEDSDKGTKTVVAWKRSADGFEMTDLSGDADPTSAAVAAIAHAGHSMTTMASLFLLGQLMHPRKGTYSTHVLDIQDGAEDAKLEPMTFSVVEPGTWKGERAYVLSAQKGSEHRLEAAFDPATGAFLGARAIPASGAPMVIRLKGKAVDAALQGALGLATADLPLLERLIDWPSLHVAHVSALAEGAEPPTPEAHKSDVMAKLRAKLQKRPPAMVQMGLNMAKDQLVVADLEGGLKQFTFPAMFQSLKLIVGEVDGVWKLVRLPGAP